MINLTKKDWKLIDKYKDILVYNTYRISFTGELEEYNVFNNLNTLLWSCSIDGTFHGFNRIMGILNNG